MLWARRWVAVVVGGLALWAVPGGAAAATAPASACANVSQSALAQYCEDLPAPTGGAPQGADATAPSPVVASSLPPRIVRVLVRRRGRVPARVRRRLLALPAPTAIDRLSRPLVAASTAFASLPGPLTLILVLIAVGGGGIALFGRRRSGAD